MPNKRRSTTHRAAPKLFRCTGYGNCDMVFTRSEHLARHERKHTGEKPYKCVVPGCGRMFSRFDNMMQHTQTHEKNKKSATASVKEVTSVVHGHRVHAPPLTPIKTEPWSEETNQTIPDLAMATSMVNTRTLPPPTRRASFSCYSNQMSYSSTLPPPTNTNYQPSYPSAVAPPPYYQNHEYAYNINNVPRNRASWPVKREPYQTQYNHYYQAYNPLSNQYYDSKPSEPYYDNHRRSSVSTVSSDSNLTSPVTLHFSHEPVVVRRRISIDDLRLPIENFQNINLEEESYYQYLGKSKGASTVDITPDEYEALEGFSKFHSKPVIAREETSSPSESTTSSPILRNNSPNIAAQVCAMRQRVMTQKESFQRG